MNKRVNKWLILSVTSMVVMLNFGLVFAFGAVFVSMLDKFQETRSAVATLISLLIGVALSFGVVSGVLITKIGLPFVMLLSSILVPLGFCTSFLATSIKFLYISVGIICGIGISMANISCIVVITRAFSGSQRELCLTLINTATGSASLVYPYVLEWLLTLYGVSGTLLLLGGITSNSFALFMVCFLNRHKLKQPKVGTTSETIESTNTCTDVRNGIRHMKFIFNKAFMLILLASGIFLASFNGFTGLLLDVSLWKGFTNSQGLLSYVFYGAFNTVSRLIPGLLKQRSGVNSFLILVFFSVFGCTGQIVVYFSLTFQIYLIGISLSGIAIGGTISSAVIIIAKLVKEEHVPVAMGLFFTTAGLLSIGVGPIFGTIRDTYDSYNGVIVAISCSSFLATIFYTAALLIRRGQKRKVGSVQ